MFGRLVGMFARKQPVFAVKRLRKKIVRRHMASGVVFIDPKAAYIGSEVTIGANTVIYPGVMLEGHTAIGCGCTVGQCSRIVDSLIGDGVEIQNSIIMGSMVGNGSSVGPFAYIRPGSSIGCNTRIGDFVEIKKSSVGDGTKVAHLAYVGDAEVGRNVNIGCGAVFVNYDGREKRKVTVGDDSFIGSNVNLVAPVKIDAGAYVAAGSTITDDVPGDAMAIARCRQVIKEGWVSGKGMSRKK